MKVTNKMVLEARRQMPILYFRSDESVRLALEQILAAGDPQDPPELPEVTVVTHAGLAVYLGDDLVYWSRDWPREMVTFLEALGYTRIFHLNGSYDDIPRAPEPLGTLVMPESLAGLRKHLDGVGRKKRRAKIKIAREELARLEREAEEAGDAEA